MAVKAEAARVAGRSGGEAKATATKAAAREAVATAASAVAAKAVEPRVGGGEGGCGEGPMPPLLLPQLPSQRTAKECHEPKGD